MPTQPPARSAAGHSCPEMETPHAFGHSQSYPPEAAVTLVPRSLTFQVNKLHLLHLRAEQGLSLGITSCSFLATVPATLHAVLLYLPPLNEQLTGLLPLATTSLASQTGCNIDPYHSEMSSAGLPSFLSDCPQPSQGPAALLQRCPLSL